MKSKEMMLVCLMKNQPSLVSCELSKNLTCLGYVILLWGSPKLFLHKYILASTPSIWSRNLLSPVEFSSPAVPKHLCLCGQREAKWWCHSNCGASTIQGLVPYLGGSISPRLAASLCSSMAAHILLPRKTGSSYWLEIRALYRSQWGNQSRLWASRTLQEANGAPW